MVIGDLSPNVTTMIELKQDSLRISFPEVHADAVLTIEFQRTLRIPDDDRDYPLPPGLGRFPLRHVDDFERVPERWAAHGGVMLPMYQAEAMWLNFSSRSEYPFAVRLATGKIDAVTGESWSDGLERKPQNYLSIPSQPWLDGFCVETGIIRQFVAMPLGAGYTVEEQLTGKAEYGGLQLAVYPLKAEVWRRRTRAVLDRMYSGMYAMMPCASYEPDMGLAPGGRMRQQIYDDPFKLSDWDTGKRSRCFVHLANSMVWREITGQDPPTVAPTAAEYTRAGLPWFEYYAESPAVSGGQGFINLRSVLTLGKEKGQMPLPENTSVEPQTVVTLGKGFARDQVREGVV
jgi:hypothetical protein